MATHQDLIDLAIRCEQATGPDRSLDGKIQHTLDPGGCRVFHMGCAGLKNEFTGSIDAALTLVPKDWCADMGTGGGEYIYGPWARCFPDSRLGQSAGTGNRNAATTPLALCAAALRAREALSHTEDGGGA